MSASQSIEERVLITAEELLELQRSERAPVLLDVRYKPGSQVLREEYEAGHIPGAILVNLAHELAAPGEGEQGRKPLPEPQALESTLRRWGITADSHVVAYDDRKGFSAARAWWVLRWAGITDVQVLDGGLQGWIDAGGRLAEGASQEPQVPSSFSIDEQGVGHLPTLNLGQVADWAKQQLLVDARKVEFYRGEKKNEQDSRYGHIPGAKSYPAPSNLDPAGRFRPPHEILRNLREVGGSQEPAVAAYCGGGVTAAHQILALRSAGVEAALFVGSWSAWEADPRRPTEQGDAQG